MGKRKSNNSVTTARNRNVVTGVTSSPPSSSAIQPEESRWSSGPFLLFIAGFGLLAAIGLIAIAWTVSAADDDHADPTKPHPKFEKWQVVTAEDGVCDSFMRKRNAADPAADSLLGREPAIPGGVVTETEAECLETDYFLRDILKISEIRRTKDAAGYLFVTQGNVAAPRLAVRRNDGEISSEQRTMSNPDLYVEVRDGKIYGVRSSLHHD